MNNNTSSFSLSRNGKVPLLFDGMRIAEADSRVICEADNRWFALTLYRTTGGAYVAHVEYRTRWQGETDWTFVEPCGEAKDVAPTFLRGLEAALARNIGYPPGAQFAEKQARLMATLRDDFEACLSAVVRDDKFGERIE